MNDRDRELLSALMDGEASEHEVHQALRATGDDPALAATWRRYHLARSALHGDRQVQAGVDLRGAVAARLADEQPVQESRSRWAGWLKPLASAGVAAAVAVVTVVAWQAWAPGTGSDGKTLAGVGTEQHVALTPMVVVREDGEELVMPASQTVAATGVSPTAEQDRLNAYLTRHAQAAGAGGARGLAPYAQVVSLEGEQRQGQ